MINVFGLALLLAVLYFGCLRLERALIYFPDKNVMATPAGIKLDYEEIHFKSLDGTGLHGWFIPHPKDIATVLYFHGNGGNIAYRLDTIEFFHELGVSLFLFDYRGYGKSEGRPSEIGLRQDALAAYRYLTEARKISPSRIILFGESLGGAVASDLAAQAGAAGLFTEGAPASVYEMARAIYPFLPLKLIPLREKFDTVEKMKRLGLPKLIAHSADDDIVPFSQGEMVFNAAAEPKEFLRLKGFHNSARFESGEMYKHAWQAFIRKTIENTR